MTGLHPSTVGLAGPLVSATPAVTVTTRGAETLLVLALFLGVFVAIGLAVVVGLRTVRAYRRTGSRQLLGLGVGLVLAVAAPKTVTLVLSTADVGAAAVAASNAGTRLAGFCTLLWAIYAD